MGFCGYAFAFYDDDKQNEVYFYEKGISYSDRYIKENKLLEKEKLSKIDFDIVFWNLFCKSAYIDSNRDNLNALGYLQELEEEAKKLYSINPDYFYNSLDSILGCVYAVKPKIIGGNLTKAREHFERAITGGEKLLMNKLLYAKIYTTITVDEKLFDRLIEEILNYENKDEELSFFNEVAKLKARKLKEKKDEIF